MGASKNTNNGHGGSGNVQSGVGTTSQCRDDDPSPPLPPDGGWGWVVVFASFMSNVIVDGVCFSFGMLYFHFLKHYDEPGSKIMWAGSLLTGGYFLMGPIASALMNRFGCRRVTMAGSIIASVGFFGAAFAPDGNLLILFYGGVAGLGFGLIYLPSVVIVGYYFEKRRAFATGIALCGSGVGTLVFAPLTDKLLNYYGLLGALLMISAIVLNCLVCGSLFRPLSTYQPDRQSYRKERDIPKNRIHRGSIFTKIMEDKERQRTISQGSLDGCIITRDNQLIKASSNTMNKLLHQENLANLYMRKYIHRNGGLTGSGTKMHTQKNGQSGLAFCTRRGTEPSLSNGAALQASAGLNGQSVSGIYEPGATGSLPTTRSSCCDIHSTPSSADDSGCMSESASMVPVVQVDRTSWASEGGESISPTTDSTDISSAVSGDIENLRRDLARPMYRRDILYSGSMHHVTQFETSPTVRTYVRSTTSVPEDGSASCWDYCPYSEPVTNVFREMLDPCLFKSYTFILLSISSIATMLALFVPYVFIVQMAVRMDVPEQSASFLISMIGLCNVFGRILVGLIADRPWANALCINNIALIIAGVATMMAPLCQSFGHLVLYACVFGLSIAAFAALRSIVVVELLGLDRLTNAYGLLLLFQGVAQIVGSPVAALFSDPEGASVDTAFYLSGALILFSGLICLPLRCVSNAERRKNGESIYDKNGEREYCQVDSYVAAV